MSKDILNHFRNETISEKNRYENTSDTPFFLKRGRVVGVFDEDEAMRIRVKVESIDGNKSDNDSSLISFPLLPKTALVVYPKLEEEVFVFFENYKTPNSKRFWLGPIISQFDKLPNDPIQTSSSAIDGVNTLGKSLSGVKDSEDIYPNKEDNFDDVTIPGRGNSDLIIGKERVLLRSGKYEPDNNIKKFKTPSYVQLNIFEKEDGTKNTTALVAADQIIFYSHKNKNLKNNIYPNQDEINNILEKGISLLNGEKTVELFKLMVKFMVNHSHNYNNKKPNSFIPSDLDIEKKLLEFDFNSLLNKNIKFNH